MTKKILERADKEHITPVEAAGKIAQEVSCVDHPIWPERTQLIIDDLVDQEWHLQALH